MNILITGASGFIGSNLLFFLKEKYNVYGLLRKGSNINKIDGVNYLEFGTDEELINIFKQNKFDGVIHLATKYLVEHNINNIESIIDSNITFGTKILELSSNSGIKWFINTATMFQFANSNSYNPFNLYAATKQSFLDIVKYYQNNSKLKIITLYLSDSFGSNDKRKKIFNILYENIGSNKILKMSPGDQKINILYIDDILLGYDILISSIEKIKGNHYALLSKKDYSLKEIVNLFESVFNVKLNIERGGRNYRANEIMKVYKGIDILPGWEPKFSLKDAMLNFISNIKNDEKIL